MIGQDSIIDIVEECGIPPFTILLGAKGQGKRTLALTLAKTLDIPLVVLPSDIDGVRQCIEQSKNLSRETIYLFTDTENMSIGAKNSLLKITEEPPAFTNIMITLDDRSNMLPTILSRGQVFNLEPYTENDKLAYLKYKGVDNLVGEEKHLLVDICNNLQDINYLLECRFMELYSFSEKVFDSLMTVSTSNSFKIANSLAFKEKDKGFKVEYLIRLYIYQIKLELSLEQVSKQEATLYWFLIKASQKALDGLKNKANDKRTVFDIWLLDCRRYRNEFN